MKENSFYHSYLLRLWQASDGETPTWHASLFNIQTGEWHGFADLETLLACLRSEIYQGGDTREKLAEPETGL
jgi:hypothetical protein